jgi:hypothetical protein
MHPGTMLTDAMRRWASPTAHDGRRPGIDHASTQGVNLNRDAARWPTPAARDYKGENDPDHLLVATGRKHLDQLPNYVAHVWPTRSTAARSLPLLTMLDDGATSSTHDPTWRPLSAPHARLNPQFVEWLMGLPIGWTDSAHVATRSSHWRRRMRSVLSQIGSD